jgi:hypothetical protein
MPGNVQCNIDTVVHLTHIREPCSLIEVEGDMA